MILLLVILLLLELLSFLMIRDHFISQAKRTFRFIIIIHFAVSILLWYVLFKSLIYKGPFDDPANIQMHLYFSAMIISVVIPRVFSILIHFAGRLIKIRKGGHIRWLTRSVLIISFIIFSGIALSVLTSRFNFRTEHVTILIKGMDPRLDGLRIVHISDLHLGGYHNHDKKLDDAVKQINALKPDLIVNTGDFISYGWREFDRYDTILKKAASRFGSFAILGNHDMGTYYPEIEDSEKKMIAVKVSELASSSGYEVLTNENVMLSINGSRLAIIGVETFGRHPDIIHTDPGKAAQGTDSADFRILLAHDPNQWRQDVAGKSEIELTLSGHTHGMQLGIITKRFRWSPSKYFYPEWNGLYSSDGQYLYVNRGLGMMGVPFRIWMPPEITLIILKAE